MTLQVAVLKMHIERFGRAGKLDGIQNADDECKQAN